MIFQRIKPSAALFAALAVPCLALFHPQQPLLVQKVVPFGRLLLSHTTSFLARTDNSKPSAYYCADDDDDDDDDVVVGRMSASDDTTAGSSYTETGRRRRILDRNTTASKFTIQVCTSTSCTKRLNNAGLDQYHILGEMYALAQVAKVEKYMIIEDGTCQGGKNCQLGPCVAIQHEDFDGNVALIGMNSKEFQERVFHRVLTEDDVTRVWTCVDNAVAMMENECKSNNNDEE